MQRKVAAALVAALALALASCGGSEQTETVSKAQAISRLEAACLAGQHEAERQLRRGREPFDYVKAILANMKTIDGKIGNLEPTGAARASFDAYKATLPPRIRVLEGIVSADRGDQYRALVAARPEIARDGAKAHDAIARFGSRHICV